jgi:hypothetical protein
MPVGASSRLRYAEIPPRRLSGNLKRFSSALRAVIASDHRERGNLLDGGGFREIASVVELPRNDVVR